MSAVSLSTPNSSASESARPPGRSYSGVRMKAGDTTFERTPAGVNSAARTLDSIRTPALETL
ncbi:hypothetical protein LUX57_49785 [Actinomadura madurae]|nr:hypothetical protein [Actinomadura madurae]MCP9972182.1 hypothetical protein [Actinomadura madurae]